VKSWLVSVQFARSSCLESVAGDGVLVDLSLLVHEVH
jgi:hypothetical protein